MLCAAGACQSGLEGTVSREGSQGGGGIPGADVAIVSEGGVRVAEVKTDAQGAFTVPLERGTYRVQVSHPDLSDRTALVKVGFGQRTLAVSLAEPRATTVFVVRHAEKIHPDSNAISVPLSAEGTARAQALAETLDDAGISAVYTTVALRTRNTVGPLATRMGLEPIEYRNLDELVSRIRAEHPGDAVLVGGHSNTVGPTLTALGAVVDTATIGDYDNLYVATVTDSGTGSLNLQYGSDTGPDDVKSGGDLQTLILVEAGGDAPRAAGLAHALGKAGVGAWFAEGNVPVLGEAAGAAGQSVRSFEAPPDLRAWFDEVGVSTVVVGATASTVAGLLEGLGLPAVRAGADGRRVFVVTLLPNGALERTLRL
ncbi:MAG: phosphoglycerate mutase family protein [Gemmatimonadota bacterium]